MSVLEHGESVNRYYMDLRNHILHGSPLQYEWKLPEWVKDQPLWEKTTALEISNMYQVWHDCGKPYCRVVDDEGHQHFPDHAAVSAKIWRDAGGPEDVAKLISMDMDIHLLKDDGVGEFCSRPEAATLLLTGLAEVHSNAAMFGGIESTSFKMKWKNIDRRGKKIVASLK